MCLKKRNPEGSKSGIRYNNSPEILQDCCREERANLDLSYMVPKGTTYKELSHKSKGLEGGEPPAPGNIPAEADR